MSNFTDLVDRYIDIWNETDDERRRDHDRADMD
jgi:hypothetical protein